MMASGACCSCQTFMTMGVSRDDAVSPYRTPRSIAPFRRCCSFKELSKTAVCCDTTAVQSCLH